MHTLLLIHFVSLSKTSVCLFLLLCVFCPSFFFFLFHWGLGCSHFHTEDDEALNLRFFFFVLLFTRLFYKNCPQNQSIALCGRRDAKSTLVVRIHFPRAAKGKERRSRFFLRLLKVQKQKHIILSSSESKCLFSIIIIIIINIVRRRGRKEEQRCRLVGKN